MATRSKKTGYVKDFYLYLISYIENQKRLPSTHLSKQALQYHLNKLSSVGAIRKIGYGVWEADRDKFEQYLFKKEVKKQGIVGNIRGHGFHWKVKLPMIHNWTKRKDYLEKKGIAYKEPNNKATWKGQRIEINGYKCWLCRSSIVIYTPKNKSFYHDTASKAYGKGLEDLHKVLKRLESILRVDIKIEGSYKVSVSKQHYAKVKDALAAECNREGSKIHCYHNGREWLLIDRSLNVDELESVNPKTSHVDMDQVVVPVMNDYKDYFSKTGEVPLPSQMMQMIAQQNQMIQQMLAVQQMNVGDDKKRRDYIG